MAKRKRREKKPRADEPADIPVKDDPNTEAPRAFPDSVLDNAHVSANPLPLLGIDAAKDVDIPEAADTQPRKKRKTSKQTLPFSGDLDPEHTQDGGQDTYLEGTAKSTKSRYILFVGNLPYETTTDAIQSHFSALAPGFITRHSTDKTTGRSKGFAFLEFENDQLMRRCLKGYHHSIFYANPSDRPKHTETDAHFLGENQQQEETDGIHPSRLLRMNNSSKIAFKLKNSSSKGKSDPGGNGRRINIELTAGGGGGKSTTRKQKLEAKNKKLSEERARIRETQRKLKQATERNITIGKTKASNYRQGTRVTSKREGERTPGTGVNGGTPSKKRTFDDGDT